MAAHCCPCNGERAYCVCCLCAREKSQCVSCHPKRIGRYKNNLSVSDVGPLSSRNASVVLHSLCNFTNLFCSGQVPFDVVPHLCGATLYVLKKKSGHLTQLQLERFFIDYLLNVYLNFVFFEASHLLSPSPSSWCGVVYWLWTHCSIS